MQNNCKPCAMAIIKGGEDYPDINGNVRFYQQNEGVLVVADISGLPENGKGFFGFHIHEGKVCRGKDFYLTRGHLNPNKTPHPNHMGDLPPLLYCAGKAYMEVRTDRFRTRDIFGRTVVIHLNPDDFESQPSGDSGTRIACGTIRAV